MLINDILYPSLEPYRTEFFSVSSLHTVYFEECGNPHGKPVLFLHGGPGSGIRPIYRRYFNPARYRIILVDQRGCGKSTPAAETRDNTLQDLIADFEKIRQLLHIERWMLFGGSWGSALALYYAQMYPHRITELVLRGIFLGCPKNEHFIYQQGASEVYPEDWDKFISLIPENERSNLLVAYHKRITSTDKSLQLKAAQLWSLWEARISTLLYDKQLVETYSNPEFAINMACIEIHYFMNKLFLEPDQLLRNTDKIRHIPGVIVHGRYDMCTPMTHAWALHRAWPEATLHIIPDAGHAITEPGIALQLIRATDQFK